MGKTLAISSIRNLSLDPQHLHICQVGMVTCDPRTWETETRNLPRIESSSSGFKGEALPQNIMWRVIKEDTWCQSVVHPHIHMCPYTRMHACQKKGKEEEEGTPPVQKAHSIHPLMSHWLETECSYHTKLCSKTDRKLAPSQKWNPNLEISTLSGISQTLKDKYCMFSLICRINV